MCLSVLREQVVPVAGMLSPMTTHFERVLGTSRSVSTRWKWLLKPVVLNPLLKPVGVNCLDHIYDCICQTDFHLLTLWLTYLESSEIDFNNLFQLLPLDGVQLIFSTKVVCVGCIYYLVFSCCCPCISLLSSFLYWLTEFNLCCDSRCCLICHC